MLVPFFVLIFSLFYQDTHSWTAPLVNPSNPNFLTGINALITATNPPLTTGVQNYQFPLANTLPNNSLKAAIGIIGQKMTLIPPSMDF